MIFIDINVKPSPRWDPPSSTETFPRTMYCPWPSVRTIPKLWRHRVLSVLFFISIKNLCLALVIYYKDGASYMRLHYMNSVLNLPCINSNHSLVGPVPTPCGNMWNYRYHHIPLSLKHEKLNASQVSVITLDNFSIKLHGLLFSL